MNFPFNNIKEHFRGPPEIKTAEQIEKEKEKEKEKQKQKSEEERKKAQDDKILEDTAHNNILKRLYKDDKRKDNYKEYPTYNKTNVNIENFSKNLKDICTYMVINIVFGFIIVIMLVANTETYYNYLKELKDNIITRINDINYYIDATGGKKSNLQLIPILLYLYVKLYFITMIIIYNLEEKYNYLFLISVTITFFIIITFITLSSMGINNI